MKYSIWKMPKPEIPESKGYVFDKYPELVAGILRARGINHEDEAHLFMNGDEVALWDLYSLDDIDKAAARLQTAIETGEKVAVYGDYDVDGITAACLVDHYLRTRGLDPEIYIPDRIEEGYGLNAAAIEFLGGLGVTLIVTVDCGVTAIRETRYASELGIDMIITDHHECGKQIPQARAVVDPKRRDGPASALNLAGVGVAFKLICALDGDYSKILEAYCDLVAIGTIADVVPLTHENRFIVKAGLQCLREKPRPGLKALMKEAGLKEKSIGSTGVSFGIAPRLNAAGRLGMAKMAVELLATTKPSRAQELARGLCGLNRERQSIETRIWKESLEALGGQTPDCPIVLAGEGWHQGVVGIVASRLVDAFGVPAIMISLDGDNGKGSCRSVVNWNIYEALCECDHLLDRFGGHAMAAGLTIERGKIDDLRDAIGIMYKENPPETEREINIDLVVNEPEELSMEGVEAIDSLEPFGCGNPRPLLCITDVLLDSITPLSGGKHLKLYITKNSKSFECVFFSQTERELGVTSGSRIDIAFFPQINEFRSRRTVQLSVVDIRLSQIYPECLELFDSAHNSSCAVEHVPVREDFARLWRGLEHCGGSINGPLPDVLERLVPGEHPIKLSLSLAVLSELGLLFLDHNAKGDIAVESVKTNQKVSLDSSSILRGLRERKNRALTL